MDLIIKTLEKRFWDKVEMIPFHDCWEWTGSLNSHGYGQIREGGKKERVLLSHRAIWIMSFGEIPKGMFVCHTCDNSSCVRPSHLFLGTNQDNMNDMKQKRRQKGNNPRFSKKDRNKMRKLKKVKTYKEIAKIFGTTANYVGQVISNRKGKRDKTTLKEG